MKKMLSNNIHTKNSIIDEILREPIPIIKNSKLVDNIWDLKRMKLLEQPYKMNVV